MENSRVYIDALKDIIVKKTVIFENIYNVVQEQEKSLKDSELDVDYFNELLEEKEELLKNVEELDKSFENIYERVKEIFANDKETYKSDIVALQEKIRYITSIGIKIKVLEQQNKTKMEYYIKNKKNSIKNFNNNISMTQKYSQNMTNQHYGQSYFYDKKK